MQKIICMKWGSRYGPEFVNRLHKSIKNHTKRRTKLYCFTDNTDGIDKSITCMPLPKISLPKDISSTPWRKISIWKYPLIEFNGDILFLDLDLVITGNLDKFFEYKKGKYCVIENWTQIGKKIGNTSCFRFPTNRYNYIFEDFDPKGNKIISRMFDMKNEEEGSTKKQTNKEHFKKLDKDRRDKGCEYAVLISNLETDDERYNSGFTTVYHEYPKMIVARPNCFISVIYTLRELELSYCVLKIYLKRSNQNLLILQISENH